MVQKCSRGGASEDSTMSSSDGLGLLHYRDVHSVCSWDEKASVKIQKALETEILAFIEEAQKVSYHALMTSKLCTPSLPTPSLPTPITTHPLTTHPLTTYSSPSLFTLPLSSPQLYTSPPHMIPLPCTHAFSVYFSMMRNLRC